MSQNTVRTFIHRNVERQRQRISTQRDRDRFRGPHSEDPEGTKVTLQAEQVGELSVGKEKYT